MFETDLHYFVFENFFRKIVMETSIVIQINPKKLKIFWPPFVTEIVIPPGTQGVTLKNLS